MLSRHRGETVPECGKPTRLGSATAAKLGTRMRINKDLSVAAGMVVGAFTIIQVLIMTLEAMARHG